MECQSSAAAGATPGRGLFSAAGGIPEQSRQSAPGQHGAANWNDHVVLPIALVHYYWHCPLQLVQSDAARWCRADTRHTPNFRHGMIMAEWLILQLPGAGNPSCNWMLV